jgi:hypothetical protein
LTLQAAALGARVTAIDLAPNMVDRLRQRLAPYLSGFSVALAVGLIGLAHVGFDRLLGFGLKYPLGFGYTHLGRAGKEAR